MHFCEAKRVRCMVKQCSSYEAKRVRYLMRFTDTLVVE
jgi:hypothetical protein